MGSTLIYVLFVSNAGPYPATNVVVTDTLPDGVDFISATPNQGNCGIAGKIVTCNLGNLEVGTFTEVRILVKPTVTGTILNVAEIKGDEHDPKSSNNISPQTTTVLLRPINPPEPGEPNGNDLFVLKFVSPNPAEVGDEVLFTIILGNNGEFGSGVTLVDDLPNGLTFLSATSSTGEECTFDGEEVRCEIGTVPPLGQGETVIIEILVRADQTGSIPNIAFLDDIPDDPNTTNNVSIVALNVVPGGGTPQPTPGPNPGPTPVPSDDNPGSSDGTNNSACTVAAGSVNPVNSAVNFVLLLLPLLVFGMRSLRRKK